VLLFGGIALDETRATVATRRLVDRSHLAVEAAGSVLADLTEAESSERGYLLTGHGSYLLSYHAARSRVPSDLERLAAFAERPGPRARALDTLRALATAKIEQLDRGIGARAEGATRTAAAPLRNGQDARIMQAVRASVARLAAAERTTLARQSALEARRNRTTDIVLVAGSLAAGALSLLVTMLLTGEARSLGAVVVERDRALSEAKRARDHAALLAEAGAALASTQNPEDALGMIARLVVPRLADWCVVDLRAPGGETRRIAVVHSDPQKVELAWRLGREYPEAPDAPGGLQEVLRTGRTVYAREIPPELYVTSARDAGHLAMLQSLGLTSYAVVPIIVGDETIGAVGLVAAESGRALEPDAVATAEELARRAAGAFARARLHAATVAARDELSAANATLRTSEVRLEIALAAGGFGWWEWDVASGHVSWSPRTERMWGLRTGEFDHSVDMFRSFVHPDDRERVRRDANRILEGGSGHYYLKFRIVRPDGAVCWIETQAVVVRDAIGAPVRLLGVAADVTARETAEQERRLLAERAEAARVDAEMARRAAEQANQAKSDFLATMSHELRTPLNAIGGYAELMALGIRGDVTAEQQADLARIRSAGRYLLALINDILNYARLEAGRVEIAVADVHLDELSRDIDALVAPQMQRKGLQYSVEIPAPAPVLRGDPEKVRQILVNLLTNAVKFTESGGSVSLTASTDDCWVTLSVGDTGRGIPADRLPQIFDPFVQVDRHLSDAAQQGVGLGLAISRDLARAMDGELVAESSPGAGSVFRLRLPRAGPALLAARSDAGAAA